MDRRGAAQTSLKPLHNAPVFEPAVYVRRALKLFEVCRKELGDEIELLHDVHERVSPNQAVQFAKDVEKFKLFFMEDLAVARRHRVLPPDSPEVRYAVRDGGTVQ